MIKIPVFKEVKDKVIDEYRKPSFDAATGISPEEIKKHLLEMEKDEVTPLPIRISNETAFILQNARIEINRYGAFPDKFDVGVDYTKADDASHSVYGVIARERYRTYMAKLCPRTWEDRKAAALAGTACPDTDFWHDLPDWSAIHRYGAHGLLSRAENEKARKEESGYLTDNQRIFYDSVIIVYSAIVAYINRLAAEAEKIGMNELASRYRFLAANAPETLWDVMELSYIFLYIGELGIERYRTFGMIDTLYYPYFRRDIECGRITEETAREYFRFFFSKIAAAGRYADQPIGIGGELPDGSSAVNELTYIILSVYGELNIHNPKIHVRYSEKNGDVFLAAALDLIRKGHSSITVINDETVYAGYKRIGVPLSLARRYVPIGCYEPTIMGYEDSRICSSWINLAKPVFLAVHGGEPDGRYSPYAVKTETAPETFEEFMEAVYKHFFAVIEFTKKNIIEQSVWQYKCNPSPMLSGTMQPCIDSGRDFFDHGMPMQNSSIKCFAVGTAVDSILAVKREVYEKKNLTLREFSDILKKNWEGEEKLRLRIRNDKLKWGNNCPEADEIGRALFEFAFNHIVNAPNGMGGVFRLGADSVAMSENYGKFLGATPDGRFRGEPTSKNLRPVNGMDRGGITALIQSVTAIDHTWLLDAAPMDFMLHPTACAGEEGLAALLSLCKVYFQHGGFDFQGNVIGVETLLDAQKNPDSYRNLQVRVCGWNEYFVNMNKTLQEDFIRRAKDHAGM